MANSTNNFNFEQFTNEIKEKLEAIRDKYEIKKIEKELIEQRKALVKILDSQEVIEPFLKKSLEVLGKKTSDWVINEIKDNISIEFNKEGLVKEPKFFQQPASFFKKQSKLAAPKIEVDSLKELKNTLIAIQEYIKSNFSNLKITTKKNEITNWDSYVINIMKQQLSYIMPFLNTDNFSFSIKNADYNIFIKQHGKKIRTLLQEIINYANINTSLIKVQAALVEVLTGFAMQFFPVKLIEDFNKLDNDNKQEKITALTNSLLTGTANVSFSEDDVEKLIKDLKEAKYFGNSEEINVEDFYSKISVLLKSSAPQGKIDAIISVTDKNYGTNDSVGASIKNYQIGSQIGLQSELSAATFLSNLLAFQKNNYFIPFLRFLADEKYIQEEYRASALEATKFGLAWFAVRGGDLKYYKDNTLNPNPELFILEQKQSTNSPLQPQLKVYSIANLFQDDDSSSDFTVNNFSFSNLKNQKLKKNNYNVSDYWIFSFILEKIKNKKYSIHLKNSFNN